MSPDLGLLAFCRRSPMHSSSPLSSGHQRCVLQRCPLFGLCGSFRCGRLTALGNLVGMGGSQSHWLPGCALYRGCLPPLGGAGSGGGLRWPPGGQSCVPGSLAAGPWGSWGLCFSPLVAGAGSRGLWLVLRLLLAYLYAWPDPGPSGGQGKSQGSSGHRVS